MLFRTRILVRGEFEIVIICIFFRLETVKFQFEDLDLEESFLPLGELGSI